MKTTLLNLSELQPYYRNARRGNVDAIAESLQVNGQYKPIIVNEGTHTGRPFEVLVGNHTVQAAQQIGLESLSAVVVDVDDAQARRIVLVDNRTSDLATYDDELLADLLADVDGFMGTGFTDADLDALVGPPAPKSDPDDAPPLPEAPVSKPGDVWLLGGSRLVCGSSTEPETLAALMGDDVADVIWTDPPYGVEYVGKTKAALTIQNDGAAGLGALLLDAFSIASEYVRPGGAVYVAHADTERVTFETSLRQAGFAIRQNLIWVKNSIVLGRSDYHYKHEPILEAELNDGDDEGEAGGREHEPILYGFTPSQPGVGRLGRGGDRWHSDNRRSTVFEVDKPSRNGEHPTMKPVELVQLMLKPSCPPGGSVLDLFAGSGSTLIAAHLLGMRAYCVELDPRYCDVIVKRWEAVTGEKARLAE